MNNLGHITKMAAIPHMVKTLTPSFLEPEVCLFLNLDLSVYKVCIIYDPWLTFTNLMAMQNLHNFIICFLCFFMSILQYQVIIYRSILP